MDLITIIIAVVAICGIVWVYPRLPYPGQIVLVIVVAVACLLVLMRFAGVPLHL